MDDVYLKILPVCYLLAVLFSSHNCPVNGQAVDTHGPPRVETNPIYLDSFVPAGMQVIAHATDLMKYEPTAVTQNPTTPQTPTTSSHNPGIYAPVTPPSYTVNKKTTTRSPWWKLGELQYPDVGGYFNRYGYGWSFSSLNDRTATKRQAHDRFDTDKNFEDLDLLGALTNSLYKKVNTIDDDDEDYDVDKQVQKFSADYDDDVSINALLRKKRPPPPKAYVSLLSLYDNLNKEAKRLALNKYSGYSRSTLEELAEMSKGTSASQMRQILAKIVQRRDITQSQIVKKINTLVDDLDQQGSYINEALKDIPPLQFDIQF